MKSEMVEKVCEVGWTCSECGAEVSTTALSIKVRHSPAKIVLCFGCWHELQNQIRDKFKVT